MSKFIILSITVLFLFSVTTPAQKLFARYQKIEAYEVRPGILMMPRYTATNEVCEVGLERLQYSSNLIRSNSELTYEEIVQILDELIPASERGKLTRKSETIVRQIGRSLTVTTITDYENVVIRVYAGPSAYENGIGEKMSGIVATATWKHRKCR